MDDYYLPLIPQQSNDGEWQVESKVLGLMLQTQGSDLRLYDPDTESYLLTPAEAEAALRTEVEARRAAEAEVERLRTLLKQ